MSSIISSQPKSLFIALGVSPKIAEQTAKELVTQSKIPHSVQILGLLRKFYTSALWLFPLCTQAKHELNSSNIESIKSELFQWKNNFGVLGKLNELLPFMRKEIIDSLRGIARLEALVLEANLALKNFTHQNTSNNDFIKHSQTPTASLPVVKKKVTIKADIHRQVDVLEKQEQIQDISANKISDSQKSDDFQEISDFDLDDALRTELTEEEIDDFSLSSQNKTMKLNTSQIHQIDASQLTTSSVSLNKQEELQVDSSQLDPLEDLPINDSQIDSLEDQLLDSLEDSLLDDSQFNLDDSQFNLDDSQFNDSINKSFTTTHSKTTQENDSFEFENPDFSISKATLDLKKSKSTQIIASEMNTILLKDEFFDENDELNDDEPNDDELNDDELNDDEPNDDELNDDELNDDEPNDDELNDDKLNDDKLNDDKLNDDKLNDDKLNDESNVEKRENIKEKKKHTQQTKPYNIAGTQNTFDGALGSEAFIKFKTQWSSLKEANNSLQMTTLLQKAEGILRERKRWNEYVLRLIDVIADIKEKEDEVINWIKQLIEDGEITGPRLRRLDRYVEKGSLLEREFLEYAGHKATGGAAERWLTRLANIIKNQQEPFSTQLIAWTEVLQVSPRNRVAITSVIALAQKVDKNLATKVWNLLSPILTELAQPRLTLSTIDSLYLLVHDEEHDQMLMRAIIITKNELNNPKQAMMYANIQPKNITTTWIDQFAELTTLVKRPGELISTFTTLIRNELLSDELQKYAIQILADKYNSQHNYEEALRFYTLLHEKNPTDPITIQWIIHTRKNKKTLSLTDKLLQSSETLHAVLEAIVAPNNEITSLLEAGNLAKQFKNYEAASHYFQLAFDQDSPYHMEAGQSLIEVQKKCQDHKGEADTLRRLIKDTDNNVQYIKYVKEISSIFARYKQRKEAIILLSEAINSDRYDITILGLFIRLLKQEARYTELMLILKRITETSNHAETLRIVYLQMSQIALSKLNSPTQARSILVEYLKRSNRNSHALVFLATFEARLGNHKEVSTLFSEWKSHPHTPKDIVQLKLRFAELFVRNSLFKEAIQLAEETMKKPSIILAFEKRLNLLIEQIINQKKDSENDIYRLQSNWLRLQAKQITTDQKRFLIWLKIAELEVLLQSSSDQLSTAIEQAAISSSIKMSRIEKGRLTALRGQLAFRREHWDKAIDTFLKADELFEQDKTRRKLFVSKLILAAQHANREDEMLVFMTKPTNMNNTKEVLSFVKNCVALEIWSEVQTVLEQLLNDGMDKLNEEEQKYVIDQIAHAYEKMM